MIEVMLNSSDFCILYEPDMKPPIREKENDPPLLRLKEAKLVLLKADLGVNLVDLTPYRREV